MERAARLLWEARPVAYYAWSGVEMQTNATQIARAIAQLYALTGSFDSPGGNVLFAAVPTHNVGGEELLPAGQRARTLGLEERPQAVEGHEHLAGDIDGGLAVHARAQEYREQFGVGKGAGALVEEFFARPLGGGPVGDGHANLLVRMRENLVALYAVRMPYIRNPRRAGFGVKLRTWEP